MTPDKVVMVQSLHVFMYVFVCVLCVFKPGTWPRMPGFLKMLWFIHRCVFVCVCGYVSAPEGIKNQCVIWCDIGHVQLVKQVSRFSLTLYDTCHRLYIYL